MNYKFPIIIRNRNRLNYLIYTINSLFGTNLNNGQVIISDDHSYDLDTKKFLFSNDLINVNFSFQDFFKNEQCLKYYQQFCKNLNNKIPYKINKVNGIKDKIRVFNIDKSGDTVSIIQPIQLGFKLYPEAEYIVLLQNDILLSKIWLDRMINMFLKQSDIGVIANCNVLQPYKSWIKNEDKKRGYSFSKTSPANYATAQCYLVTKKLYKYMKITNQFQRNFKCWKGFKDNWRQTMYPGDIYIHDMCKNANLKAVLLYPQQVQHIGVYSCVWNNISPRYTNLWSGSYQMSDYIRNIQ